MKTYWGVEVNEIHFNIILQVLHELPYPTRATYPVDFNTLIPFGEKHTL
jgi:hypothetical protein